MATFETDVPDWNRWNDNHLQRGRVKAVVDGKMAGWAALTPVSNRCVYEGVAEVSVYVSSLAQGKGVGYNLLASLVAISEKEHIWTLQSSIFSENVPSQKLHLKCGFRKVGYREKIAKYNGVWKDTILMERRSERY